MKKKIALNAYGGSKWIGGVYYVRNVAFMMSLNKYISSNYSVCVFTCPELKDSFADLPSSIRIYVDKNRKIDKVIRLLRFLLLRVKIVFPSERDLHFLGINSINWIADFQHKHLPQLFTKDVIDARDERYADITQSNRSLVLSSKDCLADYRRFYSTEKNNVYVVPFVSYIEPIIKSMTKEKEAEVLQKYDLTSTYVCVMNQFWQHKNHKVVFEAMKMLFNDYPNINLSFVFTGKMDDYRNPEYIKLIKEFLEEPDVSPHAKVLGLIGREDQLTIMRGASFMIQPSLFEGWGTVVEDAKVLDKTILLSDINVHREQMNDKCILFNPTDAKELERLIVQEIGKQHNDDVNLGIADMYSRAEQYSLGFEQLIKDLEKK